MGTGKEGEGRQVGNWTYYTRNDEYVRKKLLATKEVDAAHNTGLGNFDGMFAFLLETGFFKLLDARPECRQRVMIPMVRLLSTYSLKVISELNSLNQIDRYLFKDRALLEMIGFTGVQLEEGFSRRNQGRHVPFNVSTLGKLIGDFSPEQTDTLFAGSLGLLKAPGFIEAGVFAADATPLLVSLSAKQYENTGVIVRDGKKYRGYKLITLKYVGPLECREKDTGKEKQEGKDYAGLFVAGIVVPLNENEGPYLIPLIEQAVANVGKGVIRMVVADRGFLSGENIWTLKHQHKIDVLIYSKQKMDVTKELQKRVAEHQERERDGLPVAQDAVREEDDQTTVYGFNHLSWFWTYGDAAHGQEMHKKIHKKEGRCPTHPIAGALITRYKNTVCRCPIPLLSTKRFGKSFTPLDAMQIYRKRQHIENEGFRELKQGYHLNHFPSRTFAGVKFHVLFTLIIYNMISCYKTTQGDLIAGLGVRRLHGEISWFAAVIYIYPHFGVFGQREVLRWFGVRETGMKRGPPV